jgi:hypothetical protein
MAQLPAGGGWRQAGPGRHQSKYRNIVNSELATGDKRSALDAPGTFDDDGCAEQGDGTVAAGPKPEQGEMSNKAGASSTVLEGRFGNEKVGEKRRFGDTCGTGWWGEAAEEGPCGEGAGARGEKLKDKTARDAERSSAERKSWKDGFPTSLLHPQKAEVQRLKEEKEALEKKLEGKGPWSEHISRSGQTYYYNAETKQSVWTRPPEDAQDRRATTHRISKWGLELLKRNKNEQGTRSQSELVTASSSGPPPVPFPPLQALASVYPSFSHVLGRIPQ